MSKLLSINYLYIVLPVVIILFFVAVIVFYRQFFKRFFDIVLSFLALVILSPLILLVALLVRIKLGKPVLFNQIRPGKNGKLFVLHKFRTMTNAKDSQGNLLPDDQRLTSFGKFLRSTSLDELPQIWDIFRGKMSIIGPRPQLVKDLVFMNEEQNKRHLVRGGLTGLAQVMGRNNLTWEERFKYDIEYVKKYSLFLDIKIFFLTIIKVLKRKDISTEGMATSMDYGDELLKNNLITQEEYDNKIAQANEMIKSFKGK
jgi:undecaprenyl phosphate N,N'-diacetylbacillosamine 1-phosphate transferase